VQDLMREKARTAKGGEARYYETLAESPLLFPPEDPKEANLYEYKAFSGEGFEAWAELFSSVTNV
jgi:hypothetical protein